MKLKLFRFIIIIVFFTFFKVPFCNADSVVRNASKGLRNLHWYLTTYNQVYWNNGNRNAIDTIKCSGKGGESCPLFFTDDGIPIFSLSSKLNSFKDSLSLKAVNYIKEQTESNIFSGSITYITHNPIIHKDYQTTILWNGDDIDMNYEIKIEIKKE